MERRHRPREAGAPAAAPRPHSSHARQGGHEWSFRRSADLEQSPEPAYPGHANMARESLSAELQNSTEDPPAQELGGGEGGDGIDETLPEDELRQRVGNMIESEMVFSTGGWTGGHDPVEERLRDMEDQMAHRTAESLRNADLRAARTRTKLERDEERVRLSRDRSDPDAVLRRQMEAMEENMARKEKEIRATMDRQTRAGEASRRRRRGSQQSAEHKRRREDLFKYEFAEEPEAARRPWAEAENEAAELSATLDAVAADMARNKQREVELKAKIKAVAHSHGQIEDRLGALHAAVGGVKLSRSDGSLRVSGIESDLKLLASEHEAQAAELTAAEARLAVLRGQAGAADYLGAGEDLDIDARLLHAIDRKHALIRNSRRALASAVAELSEALSEQIQRHTELSSQFSVAEMTIKAMKSVLLGESV